MTDCACPRNAAIMPPSAEPAGSTELGHDLTRELLRKLGRVSAGDPCAFECEESEDPRVCSSSRDEPELVAATVLLGRALETAPGLLRRLTNDAAVAILVVPHEDWIAPLADAIHIALEDEGPSPNRAEKRGGSDPVPPGPIVISAVEGPPSRGRDRYRDAKAAQAFRQHRSLIGITTPFGRHLPEDLVLALEERIVLGGLDAPSVALVVEHIVGVAPGHAISAEVARAVKPRDLGIALHPARGADGSIERLSAVVGARLRMAEPCKGRRLEDLAGYGAAREWGLRTAADLAACVAGELEASEIEPGVLLAGPPGTGKTMFAAAMARQAGVPLVSGSLAQWQAAGEAHLGTTLKAMRSFFHAAREASPCIALIDELDSFGDRRRFADQSRHYATQVVNGLLECLDGASDRTGIVLVGTTNDPRRIDPAILRSGRFDRCMVVPLPSMAGLESILRHHLGGDLAGVDLSAAARRALGGSGADCAAWVRRARGRARRAGRATTLIDLMSEIDHAIDARSTEQDRRIAVHECGHAVVAHAFGMKLGVVRLDAPGGGGGIELHTPTDPATGTTLRKVLAVQLAGRAAEILVLGSPSNGAAVDLGEATALCRNMHLRWGLGHCMAVRDSVEPSSEVLVAVERDLMRASDIAASLIAERRASFEHLVGVLMLRRAMDGSEVEAALAASPST